MLTQWKPDLHESLRQTDYFLLATYYSRPMGSTKDDKKSRYYIVSALVDTKVDMKGTFECVENDRIH
ncbi:hypothetical protein NC651_005670 [Populus alba x Populus x berolinensis]|nr:hypothetical protein NC651_005670 [Populus alba x Populus x berolinensis]